MKALAILGLAAAAALLGATAPADFPAAAQALDAAIRTDYAYLDKLPGGVLPQSPQLDAERAAVADRDSLLHYAEDRIASLADHHAITGSAFADSWALVPSYADLWLVGRGGGVTVDAVRAASPAASAGIVPGDTLVSVDGVATSVAIAAFWGRLGLAVTPQRADYAARVLAAGRRDRPRVLGIAHDGAVRTVALPSLYAARAPRPPLAVSTARGTTTIRLNDSLGDDATIAAFDAALAGVAPRTRLVLDLRDTASGGTTIVARALLGWFVDRPRGYQVHNRPGEERATGIGHQWVEQVLPRAGRYRDRLPRVLVGRWTGSMGEGVAIGFAALGATVAGGPMAGLNGSVEDVPLGDTGVAVKLPTERLTTVSGVPREAFVPTAGPR